MISPDLAGLTVIAVDDPADERLADYRDLTDVTRRTVIEPEHGMFLGEGELVITRALRAGYPARSVLTSERWLPAIAAALDAAGSGDTPVYVGADALLERVTGFHVHRGALASFARKALPDAAALVATARRIAVLENVNNATNLGAIMRCAAGLGMDAVLLDPQCCDPLYRRSVRVSMGEVFALPYARIPLWPAGLELVREAGFRLLALTPDPRAVALRDLVVGPGDRLALLLGAEGPGLSAGAFGVADEAVRIPMARGVDSINVAAAAAVAFYALGES